MVDLKNLNERREFLTQILLIIVFMFLLGGSTLEPSDNEYNKDLLSPFSFFHTEGRDIISDSTNEKFFFRGVNLNGLEFGNFHDNPYPGQEGINYFTPRPEDVDSIKAMGFNVIRVPFEWARLVTGWQFNDPLPTTLDNNYLGLLEELVQMAAERQLHVILDMHDFLIYWASQSEQECVDSSPEHQQMLGRTWRLLAAEFQNNPAVLGYDIMNEPVRQEEGQSCSSCNWKAISQSIVDSIRTVDENHLIFVEGPNFSLASDWQIEYGDSLLITDRVNPPRIVYSPHVFFDFNNDSQYNQTIADENEDIGPIGKWQYYLRDRLLPIIDWSYDNNVPIFIGETNVPCTKEWADVLDYAFVNFFDPLRLSVIAWHYINQDYCPLSECPLNLAACPEMHQLTVFKNHPGGVYEDFDDFVIIPSDSRIYDDERVNPWNTGDGFFDDVEIDFCANDPVAQGNCSMAVHFNQNNFAGVKFIHEYGLDTRRFKTLKFKIYLTGNAEQNFKIFTTYPLSDCEPGEDIIYPPNEMQPELKNFVSPLDSTWQQVEIPLDFVVNDSMSIINGIAFQNIGMSQEVFYLDDISITGDSISTSVTQIDDLIPDSFVLYQNYPNPFNELTTIRYSIPKASQVTINVYNILGQQIEALIDKDQVAGEHSVKWDASKVSSGLYFYRIVDGKNSKSKRLIVLK